LKLRLLHLLGLWHQFRRLGQLHQFRPECLARLECLVGLLHQLRLLGQWLQSRLLSLLVLSRRLGLLGLLRQRCPECLVDLWHRLGLWLLSNLLRPLGL